MRVETAPTPASPPHPSRSVSTTLSALTTDSPGGERSPLWRMSIASRVQLGPDGLAERCVTSSPAVGHLGDEHQAAAALVVVTRPAQVRGRAAGVGDLADQRSVMDQAQADRGGAVADRVGDQLAGDQLG